MRSSLTNARWWRRGLVAVLVVGLVVAVLGGVGEAAQANTGSDALLAWGNNFWGGLGVGPASGPQSCPPANACSTTPMRVKLPAGTTVTAVSAGLDHTLALTSTGQVLAWGINDNGQLGDGSMTGPDFCGGYACSTTPVMVKLPKGIRVTAIAAGNYSSFALTSTGRVLAWGNNIDGQLGDGSTADSDLPVAVKLPSGTRVTSVAAGASFALALTSAGRVLAWGDNASGELGVGTSSGPQKCSPSPACSTTPVSVKLRSATRVIAVAAGEFHSLAVTSTGQLRAWGENRAGQLGDGTTSGPETCSSGVACSTTPVAAKLPPGIIVTKAAGGNSNSLVLTSTRRVLAWGYGGNGTLGDGSTANSVRPVAVKLPLGTKVTALVSGAAHALVLTSTGAVLAWGINVSGELGDGTYTGPQTCLGGNTCSTTPVKAHLPAASTPMILGSGPGAENSFAIVHP